MKEQITNILDSVMNNEISVEDGILRLRVIKDKNKSMFVESMREVTGNEYKPIMLKIVKKMVEINGGTNSIGPR